MSPRLLPSYAVGMDDSHLAALDEALAPVPGMLDMEASGFGAESYPIEVGYVLPDGRSYCSLIRPQPEWTHWDAQAETVHGISRETLLAHGRDVREIALQMNGQLRDQTVYCDGWAHDYPWLQAMFEAAGMTPAFRLENLRILLSDREAAYWNVLKKQVAREMHMRRHRASADAKLLQRTLIRLRDPLPSRF